jgi:hypothetical protein
VILNFELTKSDETEGDNLGGTKLIALNDLNMGNFLLINVRGDIKFVKYFVRKYIFRVILMKSVLNYKSKNFI